MLRQEATHTVIVGIYFSKRTGLFVKICKDVL